jgi:REase_DpnII-MboI
MKTEKAKEILTEHAKQAASLHSERRFGPEFKKWNRDAAVAIEHIFGKGGRHLDDFNSIQYNPVMFYSGMPESRIQETYRRGLEEARVVLESMASELEQYGTEVKESHDETEPIAIIRLLCDRFHSVARQLRSRHGDRPTIEIDDEYDVQDLLRALLHLYYEDVRIEEWVPSYAGSNSRMDFLLKQEKIVIEAKRTRKGLGAKELGEQLIVDIARYKAHPSCEYLVCFVYDPEGRISNPRGLENDLNKADGLPRILVAIAPKEVR